MPMRIAASAASPSGKARFRSRDLVTGSSFVCLFDEAENADTEVVAPAWRRPGGKIGGSERHEMTPQRLRGRTPGDDLVDHEGRPTDDVEVPDGTDALGLVEDREEELHADLRVEPLLDRADVLTRLDAVPLSRRKRIREAVDDPIPQVRC